MSWQFRTLIVPAADAPLARQVAATLSPQNGQGMWLTGLSATGNAPATHYVSTGLISPEFAGLVPEQVWEQTENGDWVQTDSVPGDPVLCCQMCQEAGLAVTQAQINALYARSDVTQQEPFLAFYRLGLKIAAQTN